MGICNYIQSLKDESGTSVDRIEDIAKLFLNKFSTTFSVHTKRSTMNVDDWNHMRTNYTWEEDVYTLLSQEKIYRALLSMGTDKAPGPDGFPTAFFKAPWDTIHSDFLNMITDFFTRTKMPHLINNTNLVLIPKKENPSTINDYRPIALCNVTYKCISKILALRHQNALPSIISVTQTAFVKGRSITENTSVAREIVHSMSRWKGAQGFMIIKLDMEKAFDKMNWEFIKEALQFHGMEDPLLSWIMSCIEIKKMNLLINGSRQGILTPHCGLRQGDPLSPSLFILAVDLLSHLILDANERGQIRGFKVSKIATPITHLMFADDIMLIGEASEKSRGIPRIPPNPLQMVEASGELSEINCIFFQRSPQQPCIQNCKFLGNTQNAKNHNLLGYPLVPIFQQNTRYEIPSK